MKRYLSVLNSITIVAMIVINGIAASAGISGNTVGSISDVYDTLFTPAGYAFSIWGVIYLGLIVFAVYQLRSAFKNDDESIFILQIGPWMLINNLANIAWLFAWLNELMWLSLIFMLIILISLLIMVIRLNMERWDAPFPIISFVWWPLSIYSGWIAVATIANISAYLVSIEWVALFTAQVWTIIMVVIAFALNLLMIIFRNMRDFAAVGVWALVAIAIRQWDVIASIQWTALTGAIILSVAILVHGYINGNTNALIKLREYYRQQS